MRALRWLLTLLSLRRIARRRGESSSEEERIVPKGSPERAAENVVLLLFALAVLWLPFR